MVYSSSALYSTLRQEESKIATNKRDEKNADDSVLVRICAAVRAAFDSLISWFLSFISWLNSASSSSLEAEKISQSQAEKSNKSLLRDSIRKDLMKLYGIPTSAFQRNYPPVVSGETTNFSSFSTKLLKSVLEKLKILTKGQKLNEPSMDFAEAAQFRDTLELQWLAKEAFPSEFDQFTLGGVYGYSLSFPDEAIQKVHTVVTSELICGIEVKHTKNGRPILLQQATKGSLAGCSTMLGLEYGKPTSLDYMKSRDIQGDRLDSIYLKDAFGLDVVRGNCPDLESLKTVLTHGSVMIDVNTAGGHIILVDAVEDDYVRIRDPYHGWEVDIDREFFEHKLDRKQEYLQVAPKKKPDGAPHKPSNDSEKVELKSTKPDTPSKIKLPSGLRDVVQVQANDSESSKSLLRDSIRKDLMELYGIPTSAFQRNYPPVVFGETRNFSSVSRELLKSVLEKLKILTKGQKLNEPPMDFAEAGQFRDMFELQWLAKEAFPSEFEQFTIGGAYGYSLSFPDEAIQKVHTVVTSESICGIEVKYTKNRKPILLQQVTKGSLAGCSTMLGLEYGKPTSLDYMKSEDIFGANRLNSDYLRDAFGLDVVHGNCPDLESLKTVLTHGSVMVHANTAREHIILVDAVEDDYVRIRDPYHGWEVDIDREFFEHKLDRERGYLQVAPKKKLMVPLTSLQMIRKKLS